MEVIEPFIEIDIIDGDVKDGDDGYGKIMTGKLRVHSKYCK